MLIAALVVMGPVLLACGLVDLLRRRRFDTSAVRATGTVVACEQSPGVEASRPTYVLRVIFTAPTGETVQFSDDSTVAHMVGAEVPVAHAPRPPWPARVAEATSGSTLRAYGLMLVGGLATIALVAVLVTRSG